MSAQLRVRFPQEFLSIVEEESAKREQKQKDFIIAAVKQYLNSDGTQRRNEPYSPGLRKIVTKYEGYCSKCNSFVPVGMTAWYGKSLKGSRPVLVCLDCMVLGMSDRTLAKKYLKIKEFQAIVRGLKKEADDLSSKLFDPNQLKRNEEFQRTVTEAIRRYGKMLDANTPEDERENLQKLLSVLKNADRIRKGMDDFLYFQVQRLKRSKAPRVHS